MEEFSFRPLPQKGKIHSKDEFELCYLRHQYVRRTKRNPTAEEMAPYKRTIKTQANNTFFTYKNLFISVGLDQEDIMSVGDVQLVSYLGLFAVDATPQRRRDFEKKFYNAKKTYPNEKDVMDRNMAIFTKFLKQRMEDVVRVCRQKARNIKGTITDEYQIFVGPNKPCRNLRELVENYSELGFNKIDISAFRTIRKKSGERNSVFQFQNKWYVCVPVRHTILTIDDLDGADMNPNSLLHNMSPEQLFLQIEENREFEQKKTEFETLEAKERARIVRAFVNKNRLNAAFAGEIETARKMLATLEKS